MPFKKSLLVCLLVCLIILLPGFLYYFNFDYMNQVVNIIDGTGSAKEDAEPEVRVPINFSGLVYGPDKAELVTGKNEYWHLLAEKRAEEEKTERGNNEDTGAEKDFTGPAEPAGSSEDSSSDQSSAEARTEQEEAPEVKAETGKTSIRQKEQEMIDYINQARSKAGLSSLSYCSQLTSVARAKSRDMIDNNYFSHTSPRYGGLGDMLSAHGVSYRSAGENLAMNTNGSVRTAHNSLMNSSGHRANILGNYKKVGVGIEVKSDGSHYYTQLFIGN